jgi:hypothetical protein
MCDYLDSLPIYKRKRIKFAWDDPREDMVSRIEYIVKRVKPYKLGCFVLIGYWSTEAQDVFRVETLRRFGIDSFVMPFDKFDKYQSSFTRYVNMKAEFKSQTWEDYKKRKKVPDGPK